MTEEGGTTVGVEYDDETTTQEQLRLFRVIRFLTTNSIEAGGSNDDDH